MRDCSFRMRMKYRGLCEQVLDKNLVEELTFQFAFFYETSKSFRLCISRTNHIEKLSTD